MRKEEVSILTWRVGRTVPTSWPVRRLHAICTFIKKTEDRVFLAFGTKIKTNNLQNALGVMIFAEPYRVEKFRFDVTFDFSCVGLVD